MANSSGKYTYFQFIVYPESVRDDWIKVLKGTHAPFAISPLHAPDDEQTKPHHHVIYKHGNPITLKCALNILRPLDVAANGFVEPCYSRGGSQRYLIHLDDEDKEQFQDGKEAITILGGFPLDLSRDMSADELRAIRKSIILFIKDYGITEYQELIDSLLVYDDDMFEYACNHTIFFNSYVSSKRNKERMMEVEDVSNV